MAEFKFGSADFKNETARAKAKAKAARTAMLSGLVTSMDDLSESGTSAFAFQRALGYGALQEQTGEAKRLAAKHGADHPYVIAAQARSEAMRDLVASAGDLARHAGHFLETFHEDSMFHGYVYAADGEAASGVTVELRLALRQGAESLPASAIRTFQTNTNTDGYFRMELAQHAGALSEAKSGTKIFKSAEATVATATEKVGGLRRAFGALKEVTAKTLVLTPEELAAGERKKAQSEMKTENVIYGAAPAASGTKDSGTETRTESGRAVFRSEVRILDGKEKDKVLLQDLTPPEFLGMVTDGALVLKTQFKMYNLP